MHPNPAQIVCGDGAESQCAVAVIDHRDPAVGACQRIRGDIQHEPVRGIDRVQVHRFYIWIPPQPAQYVLDLNHTYSVLDHCRTTPFGSADPIFAELN
ncbi:hypothetical protein JMUB6875_11170 [Nocardia sp. JMUB6875]